MLLPDSGAISQMTLYPEYAETIFAERLRLGRLARLCGFARFWRRSACGCTAGEVSVRRNSEQIGLSE
jgi:hypothetical protein